MSIVKAGLLAVLITLVASTTPVRAEEDPDFLTLAVGKFDILRNREQDAEIRLDYRLSNRWWIFKPFLTAAYVTNKSSFVGAGVLVDVYLGNRWVVTPSFSPTWWRGKTSNLNMGYPLAFRSRLEVAYRFDNRSRLGISIDHSSNAGMSKSNPGVESVMLNYTLPLAKLNVTNWFD